jgi:hypothetical protein
VLAMVADDAPSEGVMDDWRAQARFAVNQRDRRRDGESVVKVRCGRCGHRVLAVLLGSGAGLRRIVGREVSMRFEAGSLVVSSHGPRPHTEVKMAGAFPDRVTSIDDLLGVSKRLVFECHPRECGARIPATREKLEGAFLDAVAARRHVVWIPRDLKGR